MTWAKPRWLAAGLVLLALVGVALAWAAGAWSERAAPTLASPAPEAEPFRVVWRFDEPPPADLRVFNGQWLHVPGKPGAMRVPHAAVLVPTPVPRQPVLLSFKVRGTAGTPPPPELAQYLAPGETQVTVCWSDGVQTAPRKMWWRRTRTTPVMRGYFADRWMFFYCGADLYKVHEYGEPYPAQRILFSLTNLVIEEIELRGLAQDELPQDLGNPRRTIQRLVQQGAAFEEIKTASPLPIEKR